MNLEDHAGDVIRKGRLHAGASLEAAAQAAGLTPAELQMFEDQGLVPESVNYASLAGLLELNAAKLEVLARGWHPPEIDLTAWRELHPVTTAGLGFTVNCYLLWDEVTRDAALFDTGFDAEPVFRLIDEHQLTLRHLFITHGHADHIAALEAIRARFSRVRLHSSSPHAPPEQRNRPNDFVHLGSLRITHRLTPGHSPDGVTYVVGNWPEDAPYVALVGDALFAGSMGKAPGQGKQAKQHIREQIFSLPPATLLCPGHGPLTTVAEEKAHNPFF